MCESPITAPNLDTRPPHSLAGSATFKGRHDPSRLAVVKANPKWFPQASIADFHWNVRGLLNVRCEQIRFDHLPLELNENWAPSPDPRAVGIEKIVEAAAKLTPQIYSVFGGFHLVDMPDAQVTEMVTRFRDKWTIERMAELLPPPLAPSRPPKWSSSICKARTKDKDKLLPYYVRDRRSGEQQWQSPNPKASR
jgi:hypothetical protein